MLFCACAGLLALYRQQLPSPIQLRRKTPPPSSPTAPRTSLASFLCRPQSARKQRSGWTRSINSRPGRKSRSRSAASVPTPGANGTLPRPSGSIPRTFRKQAWRAFAPISSRRSPLPPRIACLSICTDADSIPTRARSLREFQSPMWRRLRSCRSTTASLRKILFQQHPRYFAQRHYHFLPRPASRRRRRPDSCFRSLAARLQVSLPVARKQEALQRMAKFFDEKVGR
jgi:hypothetical protein